MALAILVSSGSKLTEFFMNSTSAVLMFVAISALVLKLSIITTEISGQNPSDGFSQCQYAQRTANCPKKESAFVRLRPDGNGRAFLRGAVGVEQKGRGASRGNIRRLLNTHTDALDPDGQGRGKCCGADRHGYDRFLPGAASFHTRPSGNR